jgi:hypothetical protein
MINTTMRDFSTVKKKKKKLHTYKPSLMKKIEQKLINLIVQKKDKIIKIMGSSSSSCSHD